MRLLKNKLFKLNQSYKIQILFCKKALFRLRIIAFFVLRSYLKNLSKNLCEPSS